MLFLILALAAILRFATVGKLVPFTPDEEYLIYLAQTIIKHFHIIWIGVSSLGFDFYMGPFWIYFITPFLILSKGDPIILNYLAIILSLAAVLVLYFLGQKMFGKRVAILAGLTYATSALIIFNDQKAYPSAVPLLSLLLITTIYMTKKSKWWWVVFAMLYGLVFHIHLSLVLTVFVALFWAYKHQESLNPKIIILSVAAFILTISPLIAFDYFHKASNITAPIRVLRSIRAGSAQKISLIPHFTAFFNALGRVYFLPAGKEAGNEILPDCPKSKSPVVSVAILTILLVFFLKKDTWRNEDKKLLALFSLCFLIPFLFLPVINPVEYYLLGFFPLLFLIVSTTIGSLYPILIIFWVLGVITIMTAKGNFGLLAKKTAIRDVIQKIDGYSFEISEKGVCHGAEGWRYLFKAYGKTPAKSAEDRTFDWLYPDEISKGPIEFSVTMRENPEGFSADIRKK